MTTGLRRAAMALVVFVVVCAMCAFGLLAVFAQLRFDDVQAYRAVFSDVSGLKEGDFVRIAGVEVGKVKKISITKEGTALVEFSANATVALTNSTAAAIRWADPIGTRYLALLEGADGARKLNPGDIIPIDRTEPALDLDTLLGGFRPLFRALEPDQVNALSGQLIQAFQGEGATIGSFLTEAAAVTTKLADRDHLIGEVINHLNAVLQSLGDQSNQFAKAVDSLSSLVRGLAEKRSDITNAVAYTNASSATITDLLQRIRPSWKANTVQSDRVTSIVLADHDYFDNLLNTLPDSYRKLSRLGLYGDFFTYYLCDVFLKVNGKGGQPVYIKLVGQDSGRCSPK
ncbi:MCE family protein [Mycobacterium vicinigordonae]|nr:MCE family protein [Mycobacterium vicinigordonae]